MAKVSSVPASNAAVTSSRGTRQMRSRTGSVEPEAVPRRATKAQSAKKRSKIGLTTVDEDGSLEETTGAEDADPERNNARSDGQAQNDDPRRISGESGISGTTAKTSFTQEEAESLDPDVMIDILPDLAAASEKLAQFLVPAGINTKPETWKEVRTPGSRHNKQYNNRIATIKTHKPSFGSQEYIQPKVVLRALLGDTSGMAALAPWRPDNIIYKINLAQMLNSLLIVCDPSNWTKTAMDVLARLDTAFQAIAGSQFSVEALKFYIQFAAQLTIAHLQACIESGSQTSIDSEIDSIFYDEGNELRQAEALGLEGNHDQQERSLVYSMIEDLVVNLKHPFEGECVDATTANGLLKSKYQWDMLKDQVVRYYIHRSEYLDAAIRDVGGVPQILKGLADEADRRANSKTFERGKERFAQPNPTPRRSLGGGISMLKKRLSKVSQQAVAPVAQMVAFSGDVDGTQDFGCDHQLSQIAAHNMSDEETHGISNFQAMQRQQAQQIRQNSQRPRPRFTDPQPGALRISAIDDDFQQSQQSTAMHGKRSRVEINEFDPTQDEGFQTDTRDTSGADQRRREVAFTRAIIDPTTGLEMHDGMSGPSKRQRLNPGSSIPQMTQPYEEGEGGESPGAMYRRAKNTAKFNRVASSQSKTSRVRQQWTETEENALLTLVEQHGAEGVSYSVLKALDNDSGDAKLARRSAEDLRFKARNMKLTLLKANYGQRALPANWEYVKLDKKAMDQLAALRIPYEQERSRGT